MNNVCPECRSSQLIERYEAGSIVCSECGLVIDKIIETSGQPVYQNEDGQVRGRSGPPISNLKADYGLSTDIGNNKDAYGAKLKTTTRHKMRRLKWINARSSKSEIRNLRTALRELKRYGGMLHLPQEALSTASLYYRKALKKKLIRGRSITSMIAAAIYLAARKHNYAIIIKDLERISNINRKVIARCMRVYMMELNIKPQLNDATSMIPRLISKLELSQQTENEARKILLESRKNKLDVGKAPMTVAAAAIYLACLRTGERRTQQMIAEAAQTTPVTLRNRFRAISEALTIDINVKRGAAATPVFFRPPIRIGKKDIDPDF